MRCTRLAANTGRKKVAKNRHLGTIAQLCRAISSQLRHVSTFGKKLLSSNIFSICPHNMVNFGPLTAEIVSGVWSTPTYFTGFCILAALLYVIQQWASAKLCGVEQRAPPVFGRATIRLGIGPHSSIINDCHEVHFHPYAVCMFDYRVQSVLLHSAQKNTRYFAVYLKHS